MPRNVRREAALLEELQTQHGYMFADTLPKDEQSTIVGQRAGSSLKLTTAVVLKVFVPHDGSLGQAITRERAKAQRPTRLPIAAPSSRKQVKRAVR